MQTSTETQKVRAALAERLSAFPFVTGGGAPRWAFGDLTESQRHARAQQESRMRAGALRGLPSVFGALS